MAQKGLPSPHYPAAQLLELLNNSALDWSEIEEIIDYCFEPWFEAVRSGEFKTAGIKKAQTSLGYTQTFDTLTHGLTLAEHNSNQASASGGKNAKSTQRYYAGRTLFVQKLREAEEAGKKSDAPIQKTAAAKRLIKGKLPIDVPQYFEIAARLLRSSDPCDLAVGLMAVTGRRAIEVCYIGGFKPFNTGSAPDYLPIRDAQYMLNFKGPAKKRDWGISESERAEFCIPTLIPGDAVVKAWKVLKASAEYKDWQRQGKAIAKKDGEQVARKKFNAAWEGKLNKAVETAFPVSVLPPKDEQSEGATCHCFRGAYAELVNRRDNAEESINPMLFTGTIMGHYLPGSDPTGEVMAKALGSTFSYLVYKVPNGQAVPFAPSPLENPAKSVRVYESEHSWLVAEQQRLKLGNQGDALAFVRQKLNRVAELEKQLQESREQAAKAQAQLSELQQGAEPLATTVRELREENAQLRAKAALGQAATVQAVQVVPAVEKAVEAAAPTPITDKRKILSSESEQWVGMVYQAISDHNDAQGDDDAAKWSVSARTLKDISKVHQDVAKRWFEANAEMIEEMHQRHGLKPSHNASKARKGLGNVIEAFSYLTRPSELANAAVKPVAA
jgi:gas vesicle protein